METLTGVENSLESEATSGGFDGETYNPEKDGARLTGQLLSVWGVMLDGRPHTLAELSAATGGSEASVSARLSDLRKPRFGGFTIVGRRVAAGLWTYQLVQ